MNRASARPLRRSSGGYSQGARGRLSSYAVFFVLRGSLDGPQPRLAALGLQSVVLPEGTLRGHTFHYAKATVDAAPIAFATNPNKGPSAEAVYREGRMTASFVHFYFPSDPLAAVRLFAP